MAPAMVAVSLRSPGTALTVLTVVVLAVLCFESVRYVEHTVWPSTRMPDLAYRAGEECIRQVSTVKEGLLFSGYGFDPGAESRLRRDGNYEASGWVEEMNTYGHRVHTDWRCVVHYDGANRWTPVYLQVGKFTEGVYVSD